MDWIIFLILEDKYRAKKEKEITREIVFYLDSNNKVKANKYIKNHKSILDKHLDHPFEID